MFRQNSNKKYQVNTINPHPESFYIYLCIIVLNNDFTYVILSYLCSAHFLHKQFYTKRYRYNFQVQQATLIILYHRSPTTDIPASLFSEVLIKFATCDSTKIAQRRDSVQFIRFLVTIIDTVNGDPLEGYFKLAFEVKFLYIESNRLD